MASTNNEMLHLKMGARLKWLAKENGLTREELGEITGYSSGHISRFYNGKSEIPDNMAQILSELWNVRKEYILCEDDFKTDEQMYSYLNENSIKEMQAAIEYLKTLGIVFRPCTVLSCDLTSLYRHWAQMQDFIKRDEIEQLQKKYNFNLSSAEFHKAYFSEQCRVELSSPLPDTPFLTLENVSKSSKQESMIIIDSSNKNNPLGTGCEINLFFKVYQNDKLVRSITMYDLQDFIKKLDNYSKCSVETILLDPYFGSHIPIIRLPT